MKLTVLGSCSGTETFPGRHHCSLAVEHAGGVYFFDAGETCSHTAHVMGIDLLATRAIFISHTHMDHVGGLPNLLWTLRKLNGRSTLQPRPLDGRTIPVFLPHMGTWQGVMKLLENTEGGFRIDFRLQASEYGDGVIYDADGLTVAAHHNLHQGAPPPGEPWRSFSFRITAGGRAVVFSGDVKSLADLAPLLESPCDVLLMETGHHKVADVCRAVGALGDSVGRLVFIHHGRAILSDPAGQLSAAREILPGRVAVADDGTQIEL